jgi:hypothetical protein
VHDVHNKRIFTNWFYWRANPEKSTFINQDWRKREREGCEAVLFKFIYSCLKKEKLIEKKTTKLFDPIKRVQCKKSDKFFIITSSHLYCWFTQQREIFPHHFQLSRLATHTSLFQLSSTPNNIPSITSVMLTYYLIERFFLFNDISLHSSKDFVIERITLLSQRDIVTSNYFAPFTSFKTNMKLIFIMISWWFEEVCYWIYLN